MSQVSSTDYSNNIVIGDIVYSSDLKTVISSKKDITTLNLIRGVRYIGRYAFSDCVELRVLHIPETVIRIEDFAFRNCMEIQELHLPYDMEYISILAFTSSDWGNCGFFLPIPRIVIPHNTFFKYLVLLPQYIMEEDYSQYGVSDVDYEEFKNSRESEIYYPEYPDDKEFCRIAVLSMIDAQDNKANFVEEFKEINDPQMEEVRNSTILEIIEGKEIVSRYQIIPCKDIPFMSNMEDLIKSIIRENIREWFVFETTLPPIELCAGMIEESMGIGVIPPLLWGHAECMEMAKYSFYNLLCEMYGEYPVSQFFCEKGEKNPLFDKWTEKLHEINGTSILFCVAYSYKQKGYKTTPLLFYHILKQCMMVAFQIGYSFGIRTKRNHIGIREGELFSEEEMKGGIKTDMFDKAEDHYLFAMRLISRMDNRQFDALSKECYLEGSKNRDAYFIRSIPGNVIDSFKFSRLNECVGIRHFYNYNMYSYNNPPHVSFPGPYTKARNAFMEELKQGEYEFTGWPDISNMGHWGGAVSDVIYY